MKQHSHLWAYLQILYFPLRVIYQRIFSRTDLPKSSTSYLMRRKENIPKAVVPFQSGAAIPGTGLICRQTEVTGHKQTNPKLTYFA